MVACLLPLAAGQAAAQDSGRAWVDVNFGVATAAEDGYTSTRVLEIDQEAGGGAVAYGLPRGASLDVGGGFLFHPRVGVGVSLAGTAHEADAGLAISIPHPFYFNADATDATVTSDTLQRAEGAWHIHGMVVAVDTGRVRVRLFGGPSYFRVEQEAVSMIRYDHTYQLFGRGNAVAITTYDSEKVTGGAWGLHAGADVSVFFNRVFGLGALLRFSRGEAEIDDYGGAHTVKVGGVQAGGGVRFRF